MASPIGVVSVFFFFFFFSLPIMIPIELSLLPILLLHLLHSFLNLEYRIPETGCLMHYTGNTRQQIDPIQE